MKIKPIALLLVFSLLFPTHSLAEDGKNIVVTIKPLYSLVAGVVGDTENVILLLDNDASPHDFQLKPSQMRTLQNASIIFYIDDHFETFLTSAFKTLPPHVQKHAMMQDVNLILYPNRKGGVWDRHEHETHEDSKSYDRHVWLDPENARRMVHAIAERLSALYPENRNAYKENSRIIIKKIDTLDGKLTSMLSGVRDEPFIVFHDAYQYFERAYRLNGVGSITFEPNESPSPVRIMAIRKRLQQTKAKCVFREPQFKNRLIQTVTEGSKAKIATLDPMGVHLDNKKDLYFALLKNLAHSLKECLSSIKE